MKLFSFIHREILTALKGLCRLSFVGTYVGYVLVHTGMLGVPLYFERARIQT